MKQPMHVQQNAVFLINTSAVRLQDLPTDDNGTHRNNGTRVWTYEVQRRADGSLKKTMLAKQAMKPDERRTFGKYVTIRRTYRKNKSCEDFQQIITYAEENGNVVNNVAIMQYVFKGKERNFEVVAHGNKKDKTVPYLPVNLTTREKIKDCVRHQKPTKAMGKLSQQTNMINAESSAAMARDLKQIKNMRSSVKEQEKKEQGIPVHEAKRDKLHSIMIMAAEEESNGEEAFLHGITAWPEPMCIIGFPYQFHDVSRFCSGPLQYYPLGIDTTFNLGEFYVTPTAYKSLILENVRDKKSPTFVGPTLIHMTRSYSSYCHLAAKLREVDNGIADLRSVVTDGEPGLIKALSVFYPQMPLLRCTRHFRGNCKEQLNSLGIKGEDQRYFLDCIFGTSVGGVYHEGLLDSQDSETFDALLMSLEDQIKTRELDIRPAGSSPQFYTWLQKHGSVMKNSLSKEARRNAGLEVDENITTNASESVNHVLKEAAAYEEMSLPEFIALSKAVGESQRQEQLRAVIRKGKYRFKREFAFLEVEEAKWMHEMSQDQRQRHLQLVMKTEVDAARSVYQRPTCHPTSPLSVSYSQAQLTHIPGTVLSSIWSKASEYLATPNAVVQVPSEEESMMRFSVHSRSSACPNSVTLTEYGKMSCTCLMFKSSPNVCSHTVAAAQKSNVLSKHLEWVRQANKTASIYDISTSNVNKRAAGQKGGKARRVRQATPTVPATSVSPIEWLLGADKANTTSMHHALYCAPAESSGMIFVTQPQQQLSIGQVSSRFPATMTPQVTPQQHFTPPPSVITLH